MTALASPPLVSSMPMACVNLNKVPSTGEATMIAELSSLSSLSSFGLSPTFPRVESDGEGGSSRTTPRLHVGSDIADDDALLQEISVLSDNASSSQLDETVDDLRSRLPTPEEHKAFIADQKQRRDAQKKSKLLAWVDEHEKASKCVPAKFRAGLLINEARRRDEQRYERLIQAVGSRHRGMLDTIHHHRRACRQSYHNLAIDIVERTSTAATWQPDDEFVFGTEAIQCFSTMMPWSHSIVCASVRATIIPASIDDYASIPVVIDGLCHFRYKSEELAENRAAALARHNRELQAARAATFNHHPTPCVFQRRSFSMVHA